MQLVLYRGFVHDNGLKLKCNYLVEYENGTNLLEVGNYLRRFVPDDDTYM